MTDAPHYCPADFLSCIGWLELMKKHHYLSKDEDHLIEIALYCVKKQIFDRIDECCVETNKKLDNLNDCKQ
jgi:hypothetical protein